jgi:hypothetical protein
MKGKLVYELIVRGEVVERHEVEHEIITVGRDQLLDVNFDERPPSTTFPAYFDADHS